MVDFVLAMIGGENVNVCLSLTIANRLYIFPPINGTLVCYASMTLHGGDHCNGYISNVSQKELKMFYTIKTYINLGSAL